MARRLHHDGTCDCCGAVGPTWEDLAGPDDRPPLCDTCDYAQRRWDAWHWCRLHPGQGGGYPFAEPPPKSPPRPSL